MLEKLKGLAGAKINGMSLNIDLVDNCVLRCPSCAVGSIGGRKPHQMSFDLFVRILDKLQREVKIRHAQLYVYSDPFQHPDLDLFVRECTRRGIKTWLSTMLQTTFADFAEVIQARPTEFRISFPGWEKMSYYQRGAKPELFDRKFKEVVKLPRHPETVWSLVYHVYRDNQGDELDRARRLAEDNGMKFVALPSIFMPMERFVEETYSEQDKLLIARLLETPEESTARMKYSSWCPCYKQVTLDARGKVYLCELIYEDRFIVADNFLTTPLKDIMRRIRSHEWCGPCMAKKGNQYQSCYAEIATSADPVGDANKKRLK